jgi:hypothetical protein
MAEKLTRLDQGEKTGGARHVLFFDRDGFFAGVLDRLRVSLRRLGARRIRTGSTWYWDLKPDFKPGDRIEL